MPSPFATALAAADAVFDEHMGERVRFTPQVVSDFGATPDAGRPAFECVGLANYVDPSAADIGRLDARYSYEESEIEIRYALLPGYSLRKNDEVVLLERRHQPRLKISRVNDNDPERLVLTLTRLVDADAAGS